MKLFLIEQGNLKEISKPVFSKGDVYLVDDDKTIYVWIGSKASVDEKTTGAAQARTLDQQRGGAAKIITVDENQEPSAFLKLINPMGAMKVVEKNVAKTLLKDVSTGDWAGFEEWKNILYRVSAEEFDGINTMKMIQVPFAKDSLESEDCFVADLGNKVICQDSNYQKIKQLQKGIIPIYEPGLKEMVKKNLKAGRLKFIHRLPEVVDKSLIIFICVGTPPKQDGSADLSSVANVAITFLSSVSSALIILNVCSSSSSISAKSIKSFFYLYQ